MTVKNANYFNGTAHFAEGSSEKVNAKAIMMKIIEGNSHSVKHFIILKSHKENLVIALGAYSRVENVKGTTI